MCSVRRFQVGNTERVTDQNEVLQLVQHWRAQVDHQHERSRGANPEPDKAPTFSQLVSYPDELIQVFMDWWAVANPSSSTVRYDFWHSELRRRAEERLTAQLVEATQDIKDLTSGASAQTDEMLRLTGAMESLTRQIRGWTIASGAIAALAVVIAILAFALK
jgi:hypothetical protein